MGGEDKGLLENGNTSFTQQLASRIRPWVDCLAISANRNQSRYESWADAVIEDGAFAGQGPLAGLLAGLEWARQHEATHLLVTPCDTPAVPERFFQMLAQQAQAQPDRTVIARVEGHVQPLHGLFPIRGTFEMLGSWLATGRRDAKGFVSDLPVHWLDCDDMAAGFLNVNRPEDLASLRGRHQAVR